jgi:hypothetical protein
MAHILPFRSNAARTEPEGEVEPRGGAQIIIFPGVRRERHAEPPPASRRETGPQRDRLELPD